MIDIFCIIVLAVAFYCLLLYLDKRRKQRKDRELEYLNTAPVPVKRERNKFIDGDSIVSEKDIVTAFKYRGVYDKNERYENGDVVTMNGQMKCYVGGKDKWVII